MVATRRTVIWIAFVVLAALGAGPAAGQLRELNSTLDGSGTLQFRTRSSASDVRRAQVNLRSNGTAEIRAMSGADETFAGRWTNNGNLSCRITIDRAGRDPATGSGTVDHDGRGRFTRIDLRGDMRGAGFEFRFTPSVGGGGGTLMEISSTRDGSGTLSFRTRSSASDVRRLSVALRRGGDFEIRALVGATESWRGTWRRENDRRARLDADRMGNTAARGTGFVDLDGRGSFDRVSLTGSGGGADYTLEFRSGNATGGRPVWNGNVQQSAHHAVTEELRRRHGFGTRVQFTSTSTRLLSLTERTVSGRGHVTPPGGRSRAFDFTVKVNTINGGTRDLEVR